MKKGLEKDPTRRSVQKCHAFICAAAEAAFLAARPCSLVLCPAGGVAFPIQKHRYQRLQLAFLLISVITASFQGTIWIIGRFFAVDSLDRHPRVVWFLG